MPCGSAGGHWTPELIELAGGIICLGQKGVPSTTVAWQDIVASQPDVVVLACCGYDVKRTLEDVKLANANASWKALPAVRRGKVYAVDGSAYFNRPGPRIIDSLEILANLFNPAEFADVLPTSIKTSVVVPMLATV